MENKTKKYLELLSVFSHEIRIPLNAIIGFSAILGQDAEECSEEHKEWIDNIHTSGIKVLSAFNDLMSSANYIFRPFYLNYVSINLIDLFRSIEQTLNDQYWMTLGLSFRFIIEPDSDLPKIEADKSMLENMMLWYFGDNSPRYHDYDKDNVFFIHLDAKPGFVEINISRVNSGEESKIQDRYPESVWMELVLGIAKAHSGQFAFKKDGNDKTFAAITLPINQGES